ncbi:hypothetical protein RchiOBHm_Chr5g0071721 [Rosa chinensis]|uniref:Uncharacterized protein n=1 Tax=Rosa chinensis TaxID=74649 RepID=A0A2P6QKH2_ROSCH|nr:hypothetical protein RchiOBHm_Chr5g0071721 [Rosa chinensis]
MKPHRLYPQGISGGVGRSCRLSLTGGVSLTAIVGIDCRRTGLVHTTSIVDDLIGELFYVRRIVRFLLRRLFKCCSCSGLCFFIAFGVL